MFLVIEKYSIIIIIVILVDIIYVVDINII